MLNNLSHEIFFFLSSRAKTKHILLILTRQHRLRKRLRQAQGRYGSQKNL